MFTFIGWQNINNMQYYCIKYVTNILTALVGILLLTMPTSAGLDYYIENITAGFILSIITSISIIYRLFCSNKVVIYNADILIFVGLITFLTLSFFFRYDWYNHCLLWMYSVLILYFDTNYQTKRFSVLYPFFMWDLAIYVGNNAR